MSVAEACRSNLRALVRAYGKAAGLSVAQVSRKHYGNAHFLEAFFAGRQSMSLDKFDQVFAGIRAEWPKRVDWPPMRAVIPRRPEKISPEKKNGRPPSAPPNRLEGAGHEPAPRR